MEINTIFGLKLEKIQAMINYFIEEGYDPQSEHFLKQLELERPDYGKEFAQG